MNDIKVLHYDIFYNALTQHFSLGFSIKKDEKSPEFSYLGTKMQFSSMQQQFGLTVRSLVLPSYTGVSDRLNVSLIYDTLHEKKMSLEKRRHTRERLQIRREVHG